jgi:hypothetical protein
VYVYVAVVVVKEGSCTPIGREICDFFVGENNIVIDLVQYSYAGMDWRGCSNILFTIDEPTYDRGNIIVMFS